jgi:hypothetical protein
VRLKPLGHPSREDDPSRRTGATVTEANTGFNVFAGFPAHVLLCRYVAIGRRRKAEIVRAALSQHAGRCY